MEKKDRENKSLLVFLQLRGACQHQRSLPFTEGEVAAAVLVQDELIPKQAKVGDLAEPDASCAKDFFDGPKFPPSPFCCKIKSCEVGKQQQKDILQSLYDIQI